MIKEMWARNAMHFINRYINVPVIVGLNIPIIVLAKTTGGGLNKNIIEILESLSVAFVWIFGITVIFSYVRLGRALPLLKGFATYLMLAAGLIMLAAGFEFLESTGILLPLAIPHVQVIYFAHFAFFGALSTIILGFGKLAEPTGIYKDLMKVSDQI